MPPRPSARQSDDNDRAGHSRADQHPFRHLRQTNADGNALREPDPGERGVYRRKQLRTIAVVLVGNASRYAHDASLQRGGSVHQMDLGGVAGSDMRDFGFLEIGLDPIRIAVDQRKHGLALDGIDAFRKAQVGDETIDRRPHFGSLEVQSGKVARRNRLLVAGGR